MIRTEGGGRPVKDTDIQTRPKGVAKALEQLWSWLQTTMRTEN